MVFEGRVWVAVTRHNNCLPHFTHPVPDSKNVILCWTLDTRRNWVGSWHHNSRQPRAWEPDCNAGWLKTRKQDYQDLYLGTFLHKSTLKTVCTTKWFQKFKFLRFISIRQASSNAVSLNNQKSFGSITKLRSQNHPVIPVVRPPLFCQEISLLAEVWISEYQLELG